MSPHVEDGNLAAVEKQSDKSVLVVVVVSHTTITRRVALGEGHTGNFQM